MKEKIKFALLPNLIFAKEKRTNKFVKGCLLLKTLTFDEYLNILETNKPLLIENHGFRSKNHQIFSYVQKKKGLSNFYPKRKVLSDGFTPSR